MPGNNNIPLSQIQNELKAILNLTDLMPQSIDINSTDKIQINDQDLYNLRETYINLHKFLLEFEKNPITDPNEIERLTDIHQFYSDLSKIGASYKNRQNSITDEQIRDAYKEALKAVIEDAENHSSNFSLKENMPKFYAFLYKNDKKEEYDEIIENANNEFTNLLTTNLVFTCNDQYNNNNIEDGVNNNYRIDYQISFDSNLTHYQCLKLDHILCDSSFKIGDFNISATIWKVERSRRYVLHFTTDKNSASKAECIQNLKLEKLVKEIIFNSNDERCSKEEFEGKNINFQKMKELLNEYKKFQEDKIFLKIKNLRKISCICAFFVKIFNWFKSCFSEKSQDINNKIKDEIKNTAKLFVENKGVIPCGDNCYRDVEGSIAQRRALVRNQQGEIMKATEEQKNIFDYLYEHPMQQKLFLYEVASEIEKSRKK